MAAHLFRQIIKTRLDPAVKPVSFFIPATKPSAYAGAYEAMITEIKYQFSWPVTERRIQSLTYTQERKTVTATVGEIEQLERHYRVVAIFESTMYIIVTKSTSGAPGPTILVNNQELVNIVDFKPSAPSRHAQPASS